MKIRPADFENGREVDCKMDGKEKCRISIRRSRSKPEAYRYELYKYFLDDGSEKVVLSGSLKDCVNFANKMCGNRDIVEE
ncbi:MAG: hypothetical protein GTN38_01120 [Candidatus Aenigmarchaeota archaeon]|nr:hypothetical protein [Candidatus Aenigmarchaeota archaeon]NIP40230.1 hypothetical protein [Candidatus Aenigmarchaeota archaeon]NIQ17495.1 hypothetical protein [Candidatus Aenigmarchaeota archaeon]